MLMMPAKMAAINVLNKIACEGKIRKQSLELKCLRVTKSPSISSVPLPFSQIFFAKKWEFALVPDSGKSRQANESVRQTDDAHTFRALLSSTNSDSRELGKHAQTYFLDSILCTFFVFKDESSFFLLFIHFYQ